MSSANPSARAWRASWRKIIRRKSPAWRCSCPTTISPRSRRSKCGFCPPIFCCWTGSIRRSVCRTTTGRSSSSWLELMKSLARLPAKNYTWPMPARKNSRRFPGAHHNDVAGPTASVVAGGFCVLAQAGRAIEINGAFDGGSLRANSVQESVVPLNSLVSMVPASGIEPLTSGL